MLYFFLALLGLILIALLAVFYLVVKMQVQAIQSVEEVKKCSLADRLCYSGFTNGIPELDIPPTDVFKHLNLNCSVRMLDQPPINPVGLDNVLHSNLSPDKGAIVYFPHDWFKSNSCADIYRFSIILYRKYPDGQFGTIEIPIDQFPKQFLLELNATPYPENYRKLRALSDNLLIEWVKVAPTETIKSFGAKFENGINIHDNV